MRIRALAVRSAEHTLSILSLDSARGKQESAPTSHDAPGSEASSYQWVASYSLAEAGGRSALGIDHQSVL
ncbi:hypothetical protein NJB1604_18420 [Mycobacterium marinum]|nr:hypothetical protein NJB1604_18420 [Mycobacterium marinum]